MIGTAAEDKCPNCSMYSYVTKHTIECVRYRGLIPTNKLRLGDVVHMVDQQGKPLSDAYATSMVSQIKDGQVHFFRPYGVHADFEYTGGVICYVGIETYRIPAGEDSRYVVVGRDFTTIK
ncbi:MAG: hypothetical protein ACREJN_12370 [Nitrospiraceae bacterium]